MGDKVKISISVEEATFFALRDAVRTGKFRNRSHAFEYALQQLLEVRK